LNINEIFELIEHEFSNDLGEMSFYDYQKLETAKNKISYIESMPKKNKLTKWIDRNQTSLWFFILITSFAFAAKIVIENYFYKY